MNKSDSIAELAAALAKAQGQMGNASKDAANPFFKSHYADLSSIVDAIKKPLSDNGIAYVQTTDFDEGAVIVETTLLHSSGEWLTGRLRMKPVKDDPQGVGSCITYARRYGLQAIVGVAADDDDGNEASGNTPKPAQSKPTPKPAPERPAPAIHTPTGQKNEPPPDELFDNVGADEAIERTELLAQIAKDAQAAFIGSDKLDASAKRHHGVDHYHKLETKDLRALAATVQTKRQEKESA